MSRWVDLEFRINFLVRLHGMVQLLLMKADSELQLYISPVNWKPDNPPVPMSSPASFSGDLFKQLGYYRTLGLGRSHLAAQRRAHGRADVHGGPRQGVRRPRAGHPRAARRRANWDVLVGVIESTDRVQHMMWRLHGPDKHPMYDAALAAKFGDSIQRVYRRADQFVGEVLERVEPGTAGADRLGPRLPLVAEGRQPEHLAGAAGLHGPAGAAAGREEARRSVRRRRSSGKTSTGRGRAPTPWGSARSTSISAAAKRKGIVSPGAEASALADEMRARLLALTDPDDGSPIVRAVYKRDDVYSGEFLQNASELQVGMEDGYRVSWQTALGGIAAGHRVSQHEEVERRPRRLRLRDDVGRADVEPPDSRRPTPSILDIAPTVLKYFGLRHPEGHRWQAAVLIRNSSRLWVVGAGLPPTREALRRDSPKRCEGGQARSGGAQDPALHPNCLENRVLHGCGARRSDARRYSSPCATGAPRDGESARRRADPRRCRRKRRTLATQESALLVQLRRFEVERQLRIEELAAGRARPGDHAAGAGGDGAPGRRRCAVRPRRSAPKSNSAWSASTSSGRPDTGDCCSTSTTCGPPAARIGPPPR